jgi:dihydropyrimidinase
MDYTPYEGRKVTGWPILTLSRGEVVWDGKAPRGAPGRGRFLPCDLPEPAKPQGRFVSGFDPNSGDYTG